MNHHLLHLPVPPITNLPPVISLGQLPGPSQHQRPSPRVQTCSNRPGPPPSGRRAGLAAPCAGTSSRCKSQAAHPRFSACTAHQPECAQQTAPGRTVASTDGWREMLGSRVGHQRLASCFSSSILQAAMPSAQRLTYPAQHGQVPLKPQLGAQGPARALLQAP